MAAMDAKPEDAPILNEEVSQDLESFENVTVHESFANDVNGGDYSKKCAILGLGEPEKKALGEFRLKVEDAISTNKLFQGFRSRSKRREDKSKTNDDKQDEKKEEPKMGEFHRNVSLWGVPLLPSEGDERTDVILEKFLRGRDYKVDEAYEMLKNTLRWRKENKIDSILEEDFGDDYDSLAYISGDGLEGHPVCYNVYGVFGDHKQYNKILGTEESRQRFLRWRLQMMEKQIRKVNFKPGGICSWIQINDLANTPGLTRKDLRNAMKQAVGTLQDNYPEFVAKNIFINVPIWYYAFNAILSPFLAPRTKSKFLFIRPSRVTETLLKYISADQIPVHYGGLKRDNDQNFPAEDGPSEGVAKGGSQVIEFPAPEVTK